MLANPGKEQQRVGILTRSPACYTQGMKRVQTKQYRIIIEQDEDGLYVASVLTLPGCHAQGRTLAELRAHVREAIGLCLEMARTDRTYRNRIKQDAYEPSFVALDTVTL